MSVNIYGFTLLRNGVKYDYSFRECLLSLAPVCKSVYLALGDNEDSTEEAIKDLDFLKVIHTKWDLSKREGGVILSEQTNIALHELRKDKRSEPGSWGFYLQCDEVLHEDDYGLIQEDFKKAEEMGCDSIAFRYLHFWMDHHSVAINKKWYPQEIRAVKVDSDLESWGDAQSFRIAKKVYQSEARIFHYGHVREQDSYQEKKVDILKLYHSDEKMAKYKRRERRFDNQTECVNFFGTHPKVMHKRIERLKDFVFPDIVDEVYILGGREDYLGLEDKIYAGRIHWVNSVFEVPAACRKYMVVLKESLWTKVFYRTKVPMKMRSKLALEWSPDFRLMLLFSEKGIGFKG